jgi:hypothetical protein
MNRSSSAVPDPFDRIEKETITVRLGLLRTPGNGDAGMRSSLSPEGVGSSVMGTAVLPFQYGVPEPAGFPGLRQMPAIRRETERRS